MKIKLVIILKHIIYSKDNFFEFKNKIGMEFYLDSKLIMYFEFMKKMEIFYAENDKMDEVDFYELAKQLDVANDTTRYTEFATRIVNNVLIDRKDNDEFIQCLNTLLDCLKDLNDIRSYNKAISSKDDEDIKTFETIRKQNVKIMSKED